MTQHPTIVALVPARTGSKRISEKNIRPLAGHPLVAYTIAAALQSNIFAAVIVSTDSRKYAEIARYYGAEVPFLRPPAFSDDLSPDIEWVEYSLKRLKDEGRAYDCFSILRPTSPFRQPETIKRAWNQFLSEKEIDSIRAVEKCKQHPYKMWVIRENRMTTFVPQGPSEQPWHSSQYQSLPEVYVQNASLEIAWSRVVFAGRTIAGNVLMPFFSENYEGFDLNLPIDWQMAEELLRRKQVVLPALSLARYPLEKYWYDD